MSRKELNIQTPQDITEFIPPTFEEILQREDVKRERTLSGQDEIILREYRAGINKKIQIATRIREEKLLTSGVVVKF